MATVLEVTELEKHFHIGKGKKYVAVDKVSFTVEHGEFVALVGESGCGKSTIAKMVTRLLKPTSGSIKIQGNEITNLKGSELRQMYKDVQMIFQMPQDSFNPRHSLGSAIMESMINFGEDRAKAKERMYELLELVGLNPDFAKRLPHEVSGGQCQRAAIARALAINPKLVICDEATSALDVSVQAQVVELLLDLRKKLNMSFLFICHDMALVWKVCDRVEVMHRGQIVERGKTRNVIENPYHPYTKLLLSSVFPTDIDEEFTIPTVPEQMSIPEEGCKFAPRCSLCTMACQASIPFLKTVDTTDPTHECACFYCK